MENELKKVFIYDETGEYSSFFVEQFDKHFEIDVCNDLNSLNNFNYLKYNVFFIIILKPIEVVILFKTIANLNSMVLLGTNLKQITDGIKDNVIIKNINIYQNKTNLKKTLESTFNLKPQLVY